MRPEKTLLSLALSMDEGGQSQRMEQPLEARGGKETNSS